jgi:hypothetical protein
MGPGAIYLDYDCIPTLGVRLPPSARPHPLGSGIIYQGLLKLVSVSFGSDQWVPLLIDLRRYWVRGHHPHGWRHRCRLWRSHHVPLLIDLRCYWVHRHHL